MIRSTAYVIFGAFLTLGCLLMISLVVVKELAFAVRLEPLFLGIFAAAALFFASYASESPFLGGLASALHVAVGWLWVYWSAMAAEVALTPFAWILVGASLLAGVALSNLGAEVVGAPVLDVSESARPLVLKRIKKDRDSGAVKVLP